MLSVFECLILEFKLKDEEYCWVDIKAAREVKESKDAIEFWGKCGCGEE